MGLSEIGEDAMRCVGWPFFFFFAPCRMYQLPIRLIILSCRDVIATLAIYYCAALLAATTVSSHALGLTGAGRLRGLAGSNLICGVSMGSKAKGRLSED